MSNDSPELAAWKAKHGLTEINDNNEHEIRMAAEEAQSTKKSLVLWVRQTYAGERNEVNHAKHRRLCPV